VTTAELLWLSRATRIGRLKAQVFAALDHRGLRFVATDTSWSAGEGDEVRGPLMSIVLALSGRPVGGAALDGPGADRLRKQLDGANGRPDAASRRA
jgi:hypothetical protein